MIRAYRTPALLVLAAACRCLAQGADAPGPFDGTFASGRLAVELHQSSDQLSGSVTTNGSVCPLTGSIHDDRATAEFDLSGQKFPLEAGLEGTVLIVTSGGVTHRLVRQVIDGNPLSDPTVSQPIESPATGPKFPQTLTLASGATIRFPEGWTTQPLGRFIALVPTPASGPVMYAAHTVAWPASISLSTPEGDDRLASVIGQLLPGLTREAESEPLGDSPAEGLRFRFAGPSPTGEPSKVHVLARNQDDVLALILGVGEEASLQADAPTLKEMLATLQPPLQSAPGASQFDPAQLMAVLQSVLAARPNAAPSSEPPPATEAPAAPPSEPPPVSPAPDSEITAPAVTPSPPAATPAPTVPTSPPPSKAPPPSVGKRPVFPPTKGAPPSVSPPAKFPIAPKPVAPPSKVPPPKATPTAPPVAPDKSPPTPAILPRPVLTPGRTPQIKVPAKAALDPAVVGTWRHSESHVSGAASLAIETVYKFNADGTFALGSRSAGGDANNSFGSGFKVSSTGTWTASEGVLKTTNKEGQTSQINYVFHEGQLVFKRGKGKYTFWSR